MLSLPGYRVEKEIRHTDRISLLSGRNIKTGQKVVLKMTIGHYTTSEKIRLYKNEYEIARRFDHSSIASYLDLLNHDNRPVVVIADFGAVPLDQIIPDDGYDSHYFLNLAIRLTNALKIIHDENILHRNIAPENIWINPDSGIVKIMDFSLSSDLKLKANLPDIPIQDFALSCIAPEQTGRIGREADQRSDLYSLGCVFYYMLCGKFPFSPTDSAEIIYSHLAQRPMPLHKIKSEIPVPLSKIIMKLLEKNPIDRYQGCSGLLSDLTRCLEELIETGLISDFELGKQDLSYRLDIPAELFGRHSEYQKLKKAIYQSAATGQGGIVCVTGAAGIGKSALVSESETDLKKSGYRFIKGKYGQMNRNIAYHAFIQAFKQQLNRILAASDASILKWKHRILSVLGNSGQILVDVIPELEYVIGPQPPVSEVDPVSSANRFKMMFRKFLTAFISPGEPLAVFLDDMQWADSASLELLSSLSPIPKNTLLILAWRDSEVRADHPLHRFLKHLADAGIPITDISLSSLSNTDIQSLLSKALSRPKSQVKTLSSIIKQKTGGNPFFIRAYLNTLISETYLKPSENGHWKWELEGAKSLVVTDNVVDLISRNLKSLSCQTLKLLQTAACLGNEFNSDLISKINGINLEEFARLVKPAIESGILAGKEKMLFFSHDRIQEAVYATLPEIEKSEYHLRIARVLLKDLAENPPAENLFTVINQFNLSSSILQAEEDRYLTAELNLQAAQKARSATAYELAQYYFSFGYSLLPDNSWRRRYDLSFLLIMGRSEAFYLTGHYKEAEKGYNNALKLARDKLDKADVYVKIMALYNHFENSTAVIEVFRNALSLFDITIPKRKKEIENELLNERTKLLKFIEHKSILEYDSLPEIHNRDDTKIISIFSEAFLSLYYMNPGLAAFSAYYCANKILEKGNCRSSAQIFAIVGFSECGLFSQFDVGCQFGKLAMKLASIGKRRESIGKVSWYTSALIFHFKKHLSYCSSILKRGFEADLESGNLVTAGFNGQIYALMNLIMGKQLDAYYEESESILARLPKKGQFKYYFKIQKLFYNALKYGILKYDDTSIPAMHHHSFFQQLNELNNKNTLYHFYRTIAAILSLLSILQKNKMA